jgi:Fe2+ or Zn2+ uptake regulation protein
MSAITGDVGALDARVRLAAGLDVLRGAGLRRTARRTALLRVLIGAGRHLSVADTNHRIAKMIVAEAQRAGRGIALEGWRI